MKAKSTAVINIAQRLCQREAGVRRDAAYDKIPLRLQRRIEDIMDKDCAAQSCVLLGFSRCGDYLYSYTSPIHRGPNSKEYRLQVWSFSLVERMRRVAEIPLFLGSLMEEFHEDGLRSLEPNLADLIIHVCESADGALVAVHSRPLLSGSSDHCAEVQNALTVIAMPTSGCAELEVSHYSYRTLPPHQLFASDVCLASSAVLLNTTTSIQLLTYEVSLACGREHALEDPRRKVEASGSLDRESDTPQPHGASNSLDGPEPSATGRGGSAWSTTEESERRACHTCDKGSARLGPSSAATLGPLQQPFTLIDVESVISNNLVRDICAREGTSWWLLDYDTHLLRSSSPDPPLTHSRCGCAARHPMAPVSQDGSVAATHPEASCTVLLAALLQHEVKQPRCFLLVVSACLRRHAPVVVTSRAEVELPASCQEWTPSLLRHAAKQQARVQRQKGALRLPPARAPLVLSNSSVHNTGCSLSAIVHPLLPVCVRGYRKRRWTQVNGER